MVRITAVHMEGGEQHEHIAEVRWVDPATNEEGATSRAGMVGWIEQGGRTVVGEGRQQVNVGVVDGSPK